MLNTDNNADPALPATSSTAAHPPTTTISTIAVQSGKAQVVIALLQSGDWIQLKILEVEPDLTLLGDTLTETIELQKAHDDVLLQLQSKQSPVEELLRQADQLISTQRPRAEVYAAMAESLGKAWKDVNLHLEHRKQILDLNVLYHTRADECNERMAALEMACNDTMIPIQIEAVKRFLTNIHDMRKSVLESLMATLQQGNQLLGRLKELASEGTLDSRPDRIIIPCKQAIAQVERWMETLHDRRRLLELSWQSRKTQLEQCLALALLASDLRELEEILSERRDTLTNSDQLGDSSSSAELLLHEHNKLHPEAKELQERAIKITKATEQLVSSGCFAGEQATAQAYAILEASTDYINDLRTRDALLGRAIAFFKSTHTAFTKLNQLEIQLTTTELSEMSSQLAQLHSQAAKSLIEITEAPVHEGHSLIDAAGRGTGTDGVKRLVEELENKRIFLDSMCVAHKEENRRVYAGLNNFFGKQTEINTWLHGIAEAFLQGHQDMGSDLAMAKDFLEIHTHLLEDIQAKGVEINSLLLTLPPILESLNEHQREEVDRKVEALHEKWVTIKNILEERLDLTTLYVKFYTQANELENEMNGLEDLIKNSSGKLNENIISQMEEKWLTIKPLYNKLKSTGQQFIGDATKVTDPYLDTKRACLCVETTLERIANRQITVADNWHSWQTELSERRDVLIQWERTMTESTKTIDWVSKLEAQLYPIITNVSTVPAHIASDLEEKQDTILPEIKRAQSEIESRLKAAESLTLKLGNTETNPQTEIIKSKLINLNDKLHSIISDYEILLQMIIAHFKNIAELEKTLDNFESHYKRQDLPNDLATVEQILNEHEASKQTVLEMFKFTLNESNQIISRIKKQEPPEPAEHDIEKISTTLTLRRSAWEIVWNNRKQVLDQHHQLCIFDSDLHQINDTLNDLTRQLNNVKGQYGESLAGAKSTSLAFVYFEKTIELLEERIQNFIKTGENMLVDQHVHSPHIEQELAKLKERWNSFRQQVQETRYLIDLSIQYFELVVEADEWFREGNKLLVTIARKSTTVKQPEEATALLKEVEIFLKPGEEKQTERIKKISTMVTHLFGAEKPKQVAQVIFENQEMLESFSSVTNELNNLAMNLKEAEEQKKFAQLEQAQNAANLAAAKAEAVVAQAALAAAEEARKAAEEAMIAQTIQLSTVTHNVNIIEVVQEKPPQEHIIKVEEEVVEPEVLPNEVIPPPEIPQFIIPLTDAVIQEGGRFTFECRVSGFPLPIVTWYKDGISIQNNLDYQTTFDQEICTLTIEETFAEDSARFTCKAINAAGSAETSATLSVKETEPDEQLIPPSFIKPLTPATAREGSTFQFECTVQGNPLPTVQWYKNNDCIDNSPDYVTTYNNGDAILKFEEVFLEDKADYTCKAENQMGVAECMASLGVEPLEPTDSPTFPVPLSNVMARAGQKIKLECEFAGIPEPSVTWSHNGRVVKESHELKLHCDSNKATLVISEAFPKDAGVYVVTAVNLAGEAITTCNVSVKGRLPTETSDSELASDMEPIKPSFQLQLKDVSVFEGKRVRLDCVIVGQPEPEVIWYHDARPVKESTDFQLLFQGDRCSLIIKETYLEDSGEYKAVAINSAGEASSQCLLSVTAVGETEHATRAPAQRLVPTGSPPTFTKLLSDVLVSEGETICLECIVTGDPKPEMKWYLNNQEISESSHLKFLQDADGKVSLNIEKVTPEDRGVYTVKASNASGDAKCFSQLIVKSLRSTEPTKPYEEKLFAPIFVEPLTDQIVNEDTSTKFECIVTGKPVPKVKWLFNDEPVTGKEFLISTSGERQILSIPTTSVSTQGKISCIAENDVGKATTTAQFCVHQSALLPIENGSQRTSASSSSFSVHKQVITSSSSSKTSTSFKGQMPETEVHSFSSQSQQSFKQEDQKPAEIQQAHRTEEFHQTNKEPPVHHSESFISIAKGTNVEAKKIEFKPTRKINPPRFITPVVGKIVDQGADIILEGILDGYPTPEVTWTRNGVKLEPVEGSISISWSLNKAQVELKNVSQKDAGRYTCTAVNEAGTASSTADIVVKKTTFPPVFGRRLQAQLVKKGDRVIMEVEVTATPDPTITWFKDGVQIADIEGDRRLKSQGNSHSLTIENATAQHSGKYMVRAINSNGEAQSLADFAVYEPTPDTMIEVVKTLVFEDAETIRMDKMQQKSESSVKTEVSKTNIPSGILSSFEPTLPPVQTKQEHQIPIKIETDVQNAGVKEIRKEVIQEKRITDDKIYPYDIPVHHESKTSSESIYSSKVDKNVKIPKTSYSIPIQHESSLQPLLDSVAKSSTIESNVMMQTMKQEAVSYNIKKHYSQDSSSDQFQINFERSQPSDPKPIIRDVNITQSDLYPAPIIHQIPISSEIPQPESSQEESGIDSSSITKQSAFEYFKTKLSENSDIEKSLPEIVQQSYAKFESMKQSEPQNVPSPITAVETSIKPISDSFTTTEQSSSHYMTSNFEAFNLIPEPPPEMGIMPPPADRRPITEDVAHKVKQIENIHKDAPEIQIPSGGIKVFPIVQSSSSETKETISQEHIIRTTSPKPVETVQPSTIPVFRPQADLSFRPLSPRPSAEGLKMEKLWTPQRAPSPEQDIITSSSTKESSEVHSFEKQFGEIQLPVIDSAVSSSDFSSIEYTSTHRPYSALSETTDKPSADGLAMDKIWAHKHPNSQLKKTWPPQEQEPETVVALWQMPTSSEIQGSAGIESKSEITSSSSQSKKEVIFNTGSQQSTTVSSVPERSSMFDQKPWVTSTSQISATNIGQKQWPSSEAEQSSIQKSFSQYSEKKSSDTQFMNQQAPIQHYISETTVSHLSNIQHVSSTTETLQRYNTNELVVEENTMKPSELKKTWPPPTLDEYELKAPAIVKKIEPLLESRPHPIADFIPRPLSVTDITNEVYLEPGPPPEMGFAQPPKERRLSYVELIEQDLEKNLDKVPSRVLPGAIRTMPPPPQREKSLPPPLPPRNEHASPAPPLPEKYVKPKDTFQRFPDLEPFPFKADEIPLSKVVVPPPSTPSKFIKTDYEKTNTETISVETKPIWKPIPIDLEESKFKHVTAPKSDLIPQRTAPEPVVLPLKFEEPAQIAPSPKPTKNIESMRSIFKEDVTIQKQTKQTTFMKTVAPKPSLHHVPLPPPKPVRIPTPPNLQPGSPPEYLQTEHPKKQNIEAPKSKPKSQAESGYMADTDEPLSLHRKTCKTQEIVHTEIEQSNKKTSEGFKQMKGSNDGQTPKMHIFKPHHRYEQHKTEKKHFTSSTTTSSKGEFSAPPLVNQYLTISSDKIIKSDDSSLEVFPYKPDPPRQKRMKCPPPPSPSKFVKGEFRESDYESDYDGRIPPVWNPLLIDDGKTYKPIRPIVIPSGRTSQISTGPSPIPPTQFENPPKIVGPPRPKFEPIEKAKQTVTLDEILKTSQKTQTVFKPKPVNAKQNNIIDVIVASPAVKNDVVYIKPGSPPELSYAPPPTQTRYYKSTTSAPYHNATQTETSNIVSLNESTENSHRVVNIQQTTRVIKFGENQTKSESVKLEPFPFKVEPNRSRKGTGPPPPKPKKFVPGEFRGSDYESEVESTRIRPKWIPYDSDTDEPQYRKVRAPAPVRSSSVPAGQGRVLTPMEFDSQPPLMPAKFSRDETDYESFRRSTEVNKIVSENRSNLKQSTISRTKPQSTPATIKAGSPPKYGFIPAKKAASTATKMASRHMDQMTHTFKSKAQQFVNEIITDVNSKQSQKPVHEPKPISNDSDAQVYREESRVAQHGTKHIDPDTGLIYFKYDFGYEFGIVLPGVGKNGEIPAPKKTVIEPPKRSNDIELPVLHETTGHRNGQLRPKKNVNMKNVKWDPTSESEMSEWELDHHNKKYHDLPQPTDNLKSTPYIIIPTTPSPMSLSPSLPSMSPANTGTHPVPGFRSGTPSSTPSTPGSQQGNHIRQSEMQTKPPIIITPLKDIAVVTGQTARFECIIQAEQPPNILWSKNGRIIANCAEYQIHYRNGVCRLTIRKAFPGDAGNYNCTATNSLGTVSTNATLEVPGERRSYI